MYICVADIVMNKIKRNTIKRAVSRLSITVNAETCDSSIYHAFRYTVYVCTFVCLFVSPMPKGTW